MPKFSDTKDASQAKMESGVSSLSDSDEGDSGGEDHECSTIKAKRIDSLHVGDVEHQENHFHMTNDLKDLPPLSGGEHMRERRKRGICGRDWVYAEMRAWFLLSLHGEAPCTLEHRGKYKRKPVLLVTGGPGVGKSALAAQLEGDGSDEFRMCAALGGRLLAVHSIQVYDENSKNASAFVKGITGAFLRFCVKKKIMGTKQFETELEHKSEDAHVRWCHLMEWMRKVELEDPLIVVVNGLDEGESERSQSIASVLGRMQHAKLVPEWLRVVAFTRPHNKNVLAYFSKCYDEISLNADSEEFGDSILKDAEEYVSKCGLDDVKKATLEKLAKSARGNFLVLSYLKRALKESEKEGEALIEELTHLPADRCGEDDLVFILHRSFKRFVKRSVVGRITDDALEEAYDRFVPLLSVLVAAEGKLTDEQLFQAVRVVEPKLTWNVHRKRLKSISWLLTKDSDGRRSFFHGYVSEWLRCKDRKAGTEDGIEDDPSNKYRVYAEDGHALLAAWGLLLCGGGAWKEKKYGGHPGLKGRKERKKLEVMVGRWIAGRKLEKEDEEDSSDDEEDCRPTRLVLYEKKVASSKSLVNWEYHQTEKRKQISCSVGRPTYDVQHSLLWVARRSKNVLHVEMIEHVVESKRVSSAARGRLIACCGMVFDDAFEELGGVYVRDRMVVGQQVCFFSSENDVDWYWRAVGRTGNGASTAWFLERVKHMSSKVAKDVVASAVQNGNVHILKSLWERSAISLSPHDISRLVLRYSVRYGVLSAVQWVLQSPLSGLGLIIGDTTRGKVLCLGAKHGHLDVVHWLCEPVDQGGVGFNVDQPGANGVTALMVAAKNGHSDLVKWLASSGGARVWAKDCRGRDAVFHALDGMVGGRCFTEWEEQQSIVSMEEMEPISLNCGQERVIQHLLKSCSVPREASVDVDGRTWLMIASGVGEEGLFVGKCDINAEDKDGCTALMYAIRHGCRDSVELLLKAGADVGHVDKEGRTSLMVACGVNGHGPYLSIMKSLLDSRCDVNAQDKHGKTVLMYLLELLHDYSYSTDDECCDEDGSSRADWVLDNIGEWSEYDAFLRKNAVALLLDNGADVNIQDRSGKTTLMYAVKRGSKDVADLLIQCGAEVNAQDKDGNSALSIALQRRDAPMAMWLVKEKGADASVVTKEGRDGLALNAARLGKVEALEWLLKEGLPEGQCVAVDLADVRGKTLAVRAKEHRHSDIVKLLEESSDVEIIRSKRERESDVEEDEKTKKAMKS